MVYVGVSHVTQLVRQALAADPRTRDLAVEVSYNRGTLSLVGSVPTWQDRDVLEQVALAQPGIDSLILDVEVAEANGNRILISGPISVDDLTLEP